ncbi:CHAD domain-containing protein [Patulibacter defluvii]|uniref:CHAD domain-containing protein n=1 Tax=Patulibacter defluvii TaxID=3095358 RepID=UPI002A75636E|nr:CHAD domain-containing protein [Patulibacter sp. DM4]
MAKANPIPGLRADVPYAWAAAATVRVRAAELFEHAEGVLDVEEIERVHAMRVASRRLRAVLEIYAPCFPPAAFRSALRDVKRIADALGARRDPDVQLEGLERFADALPAADRPGLQAFIAGVREQQAAGNDVLAAGLRSLADSDLRGRLEALADAAEASVAPPAEPLADAEVDAPEAAPAEDPAPEPAAEEPRP